MHVIPHNPLFDTLSGPQKLFLEAWFNLTHDQSLDSYRVRCHNGRTVLEELAREIELGIANPEDVGLIAAEAKETCAGDAVMKELLAGTWSVLEDLLERVSKGKKGKKGQEEGGKKSEEDDGKEGEAGGNEGLRKTQAELEYVLTDTLPALPDAYLARTTSALEAAITNGELPAIAALTDALASDLAARGLDVASLHMWVQTIFLHGGSWASLSFVERFRFFASRVKHAPQEHDVVFCLSGSPGLEQLGEFCGFSFSATPPTIPPTDLKSTRAMLKFLRPNAQRTFASTMACDS